jgi:hypothetical protein
VVEGGVRNGPQLTAAAYRYGLGDQVTPTAELAFYIVAKEFGIGPWEVAEAPLADVLQTLEIMGAISQGQASRARRSNR